MKATNVANNGGPAFPTDDYYVDGGKFQGGTGMTLRDYFAGQAIVGLVGKIGIDEKYNTDKAAAWFAYRVAEEMITERDRELFFNKDGALRAMREKVAQ
jgi:hypothetical protein